MDDVTQTTVADQPQTETVTPAPESAATTAELEKHSGFLGVDKSYDIVTEQPETSVSDEQETQEAQPTTETAEAAPEDDPSWLPDEQQKVFPDDVIAKYGRRYGYTAEQIDENPSLRQLLHDKINSDIFIADQRQAAEAATQDEPTVEEVEAQPAVATTTDPAEQRQQYYQAVDKFVEGNFDPAAVQQVGMDVLAALGVDVKSEDPEVQAIVKNAPLLGKTLARAGVDMVGTALPALINNAIERQFPGMSRMYERVAYAEEWEGVRAATGADGQPMFGKLPDYGTPEFQRSLRDAAAQIPGFEGMVFRSKAGQVLPFRQQTAARYALLAKIMSGQRISPEVVASAVETGRKVERKATEVRRAGQALGAGRTKGTLAQKDDGDINAALIASYNARQGSAFAGH